MTLEQIGGLPIDVWIRLKCGQIRCVSCGTWVFRDAGEFQCVPCEELELARDRIARRERDAGQHPAPPGA